MKQSNEEIIKENFDSNLNICRTYKEIAEILGMSIEEVRHTEATAIKKLRHPRIGSKFKKYVNL